MEQLIGEISKIARSYEGLSLVIEEVTDVTENLTLANQKSALVMADTGKGALAMIDSQSSSLRQLSKTQKRTFSFNYVGGYAEQMSLAASKTEDLKKKAEEMPSVMEQIKKAAKGIAGFFDLDFSPKGIKKFIVESAGLYNTQLKAENDLKRSLKILGDTGAATFSQLSKQAKVLGKESPFKDEDILVAQSRLVKYSNISKSVFDEGLKVAIDLSTALGTDLNANIDAIGSALSNPKTAMENLANANVSLTEGQKRSINALVSAGRMQEAQQLVLTAITKEYGGAAKEAAEKGTGPWQEMAQTFQDIQEKIGQIALIIAKDLEPILLSVLIGIETFFGWMAEHEGTSKAIGVAIIAIAVALKVYSFAMGIATAAQTAFTAALATNPIGMIAIAIAALVGLIVSLILYWKDIVKWVKVLGAYLVELAGRFMVFMEFLGGLWNRVAEFFANLGMQFLDFVDNMLPGFKDKVMVVVNYVKDKLNSLKKFLSYIWDSIKWFFGWGEDDNDVKIEVKEESENQEETSVDKAMEEEPATYKSSANNTITNELNTVSKAGGDKQVRNVSVTIQTLVKDLNVHSSTLSESSSRIKQMITEALVGAVRDSEIALS